MKNMRRVFCVMLLTVFAAAGCSNEEPPDPEEVLDAYINAWSSQSFSDMYDELTGESQSEIAGFDWEFAERYESVYADLEIGEITIDYDSRDYEEEEIDLAELTETEYTVHIEMETLAGTLNYDTIVELVKEAEEEGNNEESAGWEAVWHPEHFMAGMESSTDGISISTELPQRGEIFDRDGEGLAVNGEIYNAAIVPESTDDLEETVSQFAEVMELDEETVMELANRYPDNPDWRAPIQNLSLSDERVDDLLEIEGVQLDRQEGREYPYGNITGHLIGYIGAITAEELEDREDEGYTSSSEIGKRGLESLLEDRLKGEAGRSFSVNNEDGDTIEELLSTGAVDGEDVSLSIDIQLQEELASVLEEDSAGGVVMDPDSGDTLALVSEPAYDSNLRYLGLRDPRSDELDNTDILFEQRFRGAYSPGSIFKPFTAAAGIEEGTLEPDETITIEGTQWQPDDSWGGYQVTRVSDQESSVDLMTAMTFSDNIYFAMQALELGEDRFTDWSERFGFGEPLPYDFPLNTSAIANDGLDHEVLLADTGYGQGEVQISPVHMTALYSLFLNDGSMVQPVLFMDEENEREENELASAETAGIVNDTLINVVESEDGTAYREDPGHSRSLAGKTGTAELKQEQTAEEGEQIGWFVSYDYEEQDLITTIMIQNVEDRGGSGYAVDLANEFWSAIE